MERRGRVKSEAESGVTRPRAEAPSGPQTTREARKGSSSGLQTGHAPPHPRHLDFRLPGSGTGRESVSVLLSHPLCGAL